MILNHFWRDFYEPAPVGIHQRLRRKAFRPVFCGDPPEWDEPPYIDEGKELNRSRRLAYSMATRRTTFLTQREQLARELIDELDERVTKGRIREMTAQTGGVQITWNERLWHGADEAFGLTRAIRYGNEGFAQIWLSEVGLDDETRLVNTVAHEFCHVAARLLHAPKEDHGIE